jgi:hypothetical protein
MALKHKYFLRRFLKRLRWVLWLHKTIKHIKVNVAYVMTVKGIHAKIVKTKAQSHEMYRFVKNTEANIVDITTCEMCHTDLRTGELSWFSVSTPLKFPSTTIRTLGFQMSPNLGSACVTIQ